MEPIGTLNRIFARFWRVREGFLPGWLFLTGSQLIFQPSPSFPPKGETIDLKDVMLLERVADPVLRVIWYHGWVKLYERTYNQRFKGDFIHVKAQSRDGAEREYWFKVWEGLTKMFNAIQRRWRYYRSR